MYVVIDKVVISRFSLKLAFFSDILTLANVGVNYSFLPALMYSISALTLINFLCVFSSDHVIVISSHASFLHI